MKKHNEAVLTKKPNEAVLKNERIVVIKIPDSETGGRRTVKDEDYFHGFISEKHTVEALKNVGDFLVRQTVKEVKNNLGSRDYFVVSIRQYDAVYKLKEMDDRQLPVLTQFYGINELIHEHDVAYPPSTDTCTKKVLSGADYKKLDKTDQLLYVLADSGISHYPLKFSKRARLYYMNKYGFNRSSGLIDFHRCNKISVSESDPNALLMRPVRRASWQYNHEQIEKIQGLGSGAFGEVFKGIIHLGIIKRKMVAVKTIKGVITTRDNEKLLEEATMMQKLDHPHIIKLIGVATNEEPIMILLELAPGGSVMDAVRCIHGGSYPTIGQKINYVFGAAYGIEYLHNNNVVHRDIAARNVLIGANDMAKITDFGLSISGVFKKDKKLRKVPTKYLAPETLTQTHYNQETDMYSFGVYIYEVFHEGPESEQIYGRMQVGDLKSFVVDGYRLGIQDWAEYPLFLWNLTVRCWEPNPHKRITSGELVQEIEIEDQKVNRSFLHKKLYGEWKNVEIAEPIEDGWGYEKNERPQLRGLKEMQKPENKEQLPEVHE